MYSRSKCMNRMGLQRSTKWYKECNSTWLRKYFSETFLHNFNWFFCVGQLTSRRWGCSLPRPRDETLFPWRRRRRQRRRDYFCDLVIAARFTNSNQISSATSGQNVLKSFRLVKRFLFHNCQSFFVYDVYHIFYYYTKTRCKDTNFKKEAKRCKNLPQEIALLEITKLLPWWPHLCSTNINKNFVFSCCF